MDTAIIVPIQRDFSFFGAQPVIRLATDKQRTARNMQLSRRNCSNTCPLGKVICQLPAKETAIQHIGQSILTCGVVMNHASNEHYQALGHKFIVAL